MIELIKIFFETKIYFRSGHSTSRRITRNFSKIGKKCPNSGQKCPDCGNLCVKIYVFSFKIQFLNREVFPAGQNFFSVLYMIVYQSALIPRNLPFPKKILVMRLTSHYVLLKQFEIFIKICINSKQLYFWQVNSLVWCVWSRMLDS